MLQPDKNPSTNFRFHIKPQLTSQSHSQTSPYHTFISNFVRPPAFCDKTHQNHLQWTPKLTPTLPSSNKTKPPSTSSRTPRITTLPPLPRKQTSLIPSDPPFLFSHTTPPSPPLTPPIFISILITTTTNPPSATHSTTQTYTTLAGATITLHLVGHSPLEAHHLWNGSRVVASHFEADPSLVRGRTVFELGAGAGLPSIVAAALGARQVVVTDFPDPDLVETMWRNVRGCELIPRLATTDENGEEGEGDVKGIVVEGYVWGADPSKVLSYLPEGEGEGEGGFDVLILADLLFRHTEHGNMLKTVRATLKKAAGSRAWVVFTSYRPWLQHKDLKFFDLAREEGFVVEKVLEKKMDRPLFEKDPGDEEVLKTVTGWTLRWPDEVLEGVGR